MQDELDNKIAQLAEWSRAELLAEWDRIYRNMPSNRISREMLIRGIAFRWQETAHGGLKSEDQKLLDRLARDYQRSPGSLTTNLQIKIGTRLRRLWNGKVYEVTAGQEGFIYDGKKYGSLSEIARLITNTRWNGRVFFGLKSASPKAKRGGADVQAAA